MMKMMSMLMVGEVIIMCAVYVLYMVVLMCVGYSNVLK